MLALIFSKSSFIYVVVIHIVVIHVVIHVAVIHVVVFTWLQVMPQLLTYLDVDVAADVRSIDWGVLAVYSCSKSCEEKGLVGGGGEGMYVREYIWKQDLVDKKNTD